MNLDNLAGLHESCQLLSPIRPDYATVPIREGFNWSSCLVGAPFFRLYLVAFRSVRRRSADLDLLRKYDDRAYAEAVKRGGLLRYFKGEMNERRECVSFCLWESREQAVGASDGASHRRAAEIAALMYESYLLERYEVVKDGSSGDVAFRRLDGRTAQGGREA